MSDIIIKQLLNKIESQNKEIFSLKADRDVEAFRIGFEQAVFKQARKDFIKRIERQ